MSNKSTKKNKAKKLESKKIILSILVCVLIQAGMLYAFFNFLPDKEIFNRNNLQEFTITVEDTQYIHRAGKQTADDFEVYAVGVCYRFRDRVFGEPGPNQLSKQIQIGDTITVLCVKDESKYEPWYPCDWIIYDAYSDTEVYRDIDKLSKDQNAMRTFLLIAFPLFELVFLFLVSGYFWLFFISKNLRKKQKKKQKENKKQGKL